jgi:aspartyl-tRNA(Asn)/glutamyl-tRNA(Gln) amidotransferase subunit B
MRSKEEAHDYRYFPEPDLVPIVIDEEWVESIRKSLPELPQARKKRLMEDFGLPAYDAEVLTGSKALAEFFDAVMQHYKDPKVVSNWLMGELLRLLNASNKSIAESPIKPQGLAELLNLLDKGTISGKIAKQVFEEMFNSGESAEAIVKAKGLVQISDEGAIAAVVEQVIANNPKSVEDFKNGKEQAIGYLVGQVMKETKGKANPALVNKLLREQLSK